MTTVCVCGYGQLADRSSWTDDSIEEMKKPVTV